MDQAVGLRQEEIQVLERESKKKRDIILSWEMQCKNGALCVVVSRWVVLSDRGILPREDAGVLAQVQV